ncbi:MAG: hypothetical protein Q8M22_18775 [Actinomycetota bacterium]|nr:hypothetical protein [Actinomycetota bacterium]
MLRSRRLAFAAAAILIGLSACGDDSTRSSITSAQSPMVIRFGDNPTGGGRAESAPTADRMMMPFQDITYVFDGTSPDLGASAPAWTFPAGSTPDEARVRRIAELLGVEGDLVALPADQGGGWMVGASDYSTATLTVSADGMTSWWFSPAPVAWVDGCVSIGSEGGATEPGTAAPDEPVSDDAIVTEPGTDPATDPAVAPPDVMCEEPAPPAGVPGSDAALAAAEDLFSAMGYDTSAFEYDTYADEWSASVTAYQLLGGRRSPLSMSVGFGAEGAVTWASGMLAAPVQAADYPLVSVQEALDRLNDESGRFMYYGGAGPMARGEATIDPAATEIVSDSGGGQVGEPVQIDQPVCDAATDCIVEPMEPLELEPITVTLTDVRLDLTMVWDADGTVWMLPAYTFGDTDGGQYTVIAVDDSFLELPEELPVPEPAPVETVPVESVPVESVPTKSVPPTDVLPAEVDQTIATDLLVGLSLDEATKVAEENGWSVRVSTLDGEGQVVTDDLRPNRVNVAVTDGVVTGIDSIG